MLRNCILSTVGLILITIPQAITHQKEGIDFFMIGDYGWVQDLTDPNLTFNKMNEIISNQTDPRNDIDFIMTMGDNIYPKETEPTDEEFDIMMSLFNDRENLRDKTIYAIRGNHDCYFDINREVDYLKKYPNWYMPSLYFSKLFDIGNNKKFGVLFVDSCLAICSNYSFANGTGGHLLFQSPEMKILKDVQCGDPVVTDLGNKMFDWMNATMASWDNDPSIVWKATVQHHPLFGKWYQDYQHLVTDYLPLMLQHKFDFYLNGHEHTLEYVHYPYSQVSLLKEQTEKFEGKLQDYQCLPNQELFFGNTEREVVYEKGYALHQITTGTTGYDLYLLCGALPSMGRYHYAQNIYHGFSQVHVDENEFTVRILGVDEQTNELKELYKLTVQNKDDGKKASVEQLLKENLITE